MPNSAGSLQSASSCLIDRFIGIQISTHSYLSDCPSRTTDILSRQAPLLSMLRLH